MTSLTGREADLARLSDAFERSKGRILHVTGATGVGKTALVRHLLTHEDNEANLYVDVQHVRSVEELCWHVLDHLRGSTRTLQITERESGLSPGHQLAMLLRYDGRVLVLDHLNHEVLAQSDALRESLGASTQGFVGAVWMSCGGESCVREPEIHVHLDPLDEVAAEQLFLSELGERRQQMLTQNPESRDAIKKLVELCMGRPLWLIFWSRRLELMRPEDVLDTLEKDTGWSGGQPSSERIPRSVFDVLPRYAQRAWIQCSVFEGLFSVMWYEQIHGEQNMFESLEMLRAHGILDVVDKPDEVMCRIHPMCRGYIRSEAVGEEVRQTLEEARQRHARAFAMRAEAIVAKARGAFDHDEVAWLEHHIRDVQAAEHHPDLLTEQRRALQQARVLVALKRGRLAEALAISEGWSLEEASEPGAQGWSALIWLDVMSYSDRAAHGLEMARMWLEHELWEATSLRLQLTVRACEIAAQLEREELLMPLLEEGLALSMGPEYRVERGRLLLVSALINIRARDWFVAQAMCQEAAHLFEVSAHVRLTGQAAYHLGHVYKHLCRDDESLEAYERAIHCARSSQDVHALAQVYRELAWTWLDRGDVDRATSQVEQIEELVARHAMSWLRGVLCMCRGQLAMQCGEYQEALVELEAARWHLASSQQRYLLAATLYFEFLSYWALGEMERARAYMQLGEGMNEQITSIMALTCYDSARLVMSVHDGELDRAEQVLEQARARHDESRSTSWLGSLLDVHEFYLALHRYMKAPRKKAKVLAVKLVAQGVALQTRYERGGLVTDFNMEVRICWELILAQIPETIQAQIKLGMIDPSGEALILNRAQQTFRAPHTSSWVNMSRREVPFRLLCVLIDQRVDAPGEPVDAAELFEKVWPDETILPESAQNRLYVTMATLRKEGLRPFIHSTSGGYLLDAGMRLIEV